MLSMLFMTGSVPPLTSSQVDTLNENWLKLTPNLRDRAYNELKDSAQYRRLSMSENAQKGSFVLSALGFAFAIVVFALPNAKGSDLLLTKIGVALYVLAAAIVLWMSSPKFKLYTHRRGRKPEGLRKLEVLVGKSAEEREFERYVRMTNLRERRDMIAFVERRALLTATLFFISGLVVKRHDPPGVTTRLSR